MGRQDADPGDRDDERRRRRAAWLWRALALLLVFCLATLCGGSAPMRTPSLDPVSTQQPIPPADVRVTAAGDRYLDVAWSAAPETSLTGYNVYLDTDTQPAATVAAPTTTARLTGLTNGRTYTVTVTTRTQGFLFTPYEGVRSAPAYGTPRDSVPPAPPTGVSATAGDGRVDLAWTRSASTDAAAYRVVRTGPDGTTSIDVPGGAGVTAQPDTAVVNGTTYTYTVQTLDTSGNWSAPSSPAVAATPQDATAPAAPVGLTGAPGNAVVQLRWTANGEPDLASYRVLRDGVEVATVPAGTTAWQDTGLVNDRSYEYRLVAVDAVGNRSAASAPVTATPSDPSPPWDLVATPGDRRVDLTWTASSHPDVTSYVVLRDGVEVATVTGTSWTDTGLVNGVEYTFTVVAVHRAGMRSPESAPASATPHETTPPATPADLTAAPGDGQVVLSWTANGEPDLAGYELRRDGVPVDPQPGTATSHTDTGLVNGTTYTWTLVAVDGHGNRSPAATVSATPRDTTPPAAPSGFTAAPGDGQVVLSWTANGEPDLAGYELRRDGVPVDPQPGTATSHTDTGLVDGTTYTWTLVAVDTAGNASEPSTVSAAPVAPPPPPPADPAPAAPTAVSATPGDRQAVVRWTAPPDADVVGYAVLFEDGSTAATAPAPAGSVTVTGLTNGTTYRLTVVAVDAGENVSPPSAEVVVTPAAPVTTVGPEGAGQSGGLAASGDGRFVVIGTSARLESSDTNSAYELHLRDRGTGTAVRIAPLPGYATGATDPTNTAAPAVSDDGRYVALATIQALDPVEDRNGTADVYRLDRSTGRWALVSVPQGGTVSYTTPGTVLHTGTSIEATSPPVAMSADGRLVLFYSSRTDLVAGDTNGADDVFVKDMITGAVTRVSTTAGGGDLPHAALGPALTLTPDGRFALFTAAASGQAPVLYRKTLSGTGAGEATVVSTVPKGATTKTYSVERDAGHAAISDDGRYVALVTASKVIDSTSTSLYGNAYAYRKDTLTGAVVALGDPARRVHREDRVELDPTGRYAFFLSQAAFVAADTNGRPDHYRRDLDGGVAGPVVLVTADAGGRSAAGPGGSVTKAERGPLAALTGDSVLVTTSQALLPSDTNMLRDLYSKDLVTGAVGVPLG